MPEDVMSILKREHREAERLLDELAETEETDEREALLEKLELALERHMEMEEEFLYPMVREHLDEEMFEEAEAEHELTREGLTKARQGVGGPAFGATVAMLKAGVMHHVEEEERQLVPQLKKAMDRDEWNELGEQLLEQHEETDAMLQGRRGDGRRGRSTAGRSARPASRRDDASSGAAAKRRPASKSTQGRAGTERSRGSDRQQAGGRR